MRKGRFSEEQMVGILREEDRGPVEQENARLKKLLVERDLEIDVMKEIAAKIRLAPPSVACKWRSCKSVNFFTAGRLRYVPLPVRCCVTLHALKLVTHC